MVKRWFVNASRDILVETSDFTTTHSEVCKSGTFSLVLSLILLTSFFIFLPSSWAGHEGPGSCPSCPTRKGSSADPSPDGATLIDLTSFTARGFDGKVALRWGVKGVKGDATLFEEK